MSFSLTLCSALECQRAADVKHTTFYQWQVDGLMVRPVPIGPHGKRYPTQEVQAVINARIAGADDAALRKLVARLHKERALLLQAA